ncbi:MAG: hypothetical protein HY598_01550 [Candidatus Omnitrophica bacterium]|nr:hypothetical protein [Candidatus Omnitrophota bacterium]
MVSVVILAGGAVLVMQAFATSWEAITRADERSTAVMFAMSKLADLELAHREGRDVAERPRGSFRVGAHPYAWQVELKPSPDGSDGTQIVTLSVTWPRGRFVDESQFTMLLTPVPEAKKNET